MDGQRIQLVSTASAKDLYVENTQSHFRNAFSQALPLSDGQYEIALTEISCASAIANVVDGRYYVLNKSDIALGSAVCRIPEGRYSDINSILLYMKQQIDSSVENSADPNNSFTWAYDARTDKLTFNIPNNLIIEFKCFDLPAILGLDPYGRYEGEVTGNFCVDLQAGLHHLFVYLNIIEHAYVGDTKAPLLRLIPFNAKMKVSKSDIQQANSMNADKTLYEREFQNLQYHSLLHSDFHSVEVSIRNSTGAFIPFMGNIPTVLTIEFRKQKKK